MFPVFRKAFPLFGIIFLVWVAISSSGCEFGTTQLKITHDPLTSVAKKREGTIWVRQFVDARTPDHLNYIGNKRDELGIVTGQFSCEKNVRLEEVLTKYFAEALREAGYNAIIEGEQSHRTVKVDAILEGEIKEFWIDMYMSAWQKVDILIRVRDGVTQNIRWEKEIVDGEKKFLLLGISSEFEKVIRQALTKALNKAAQEFASEDFYQSVNQ